MELKWLLLKLTLAILLSQQQCFCTNLIHDSFDESLLIKPLSQNQILAQFNFQIYTSNGGKSNNHFLFPKSIKEIIQKHKISNLNLRIAKGTWLKNFGENTNSMQDGVEIEIEFETGVFKNEQEQKIILQSFSTLFCASLNLFSSRFTSTLFFSQVQNNKMILYAISPRTSFCLENINSLLLLLPENGAKGLRSLLATTKFFNGVYYGFSLKFIKENKTDLKLNVIVTRISNFVTTNEKDKLKMQSLKSLFGKPFLPSLAISPFSKIEFFVPKQFEFIHFFQNNPKIDFIKHNGEDFKLIKIINPKQFQNIKFAFDKNEKLNKNDQIKIFNKKINKFEMILSGNNFLNGAISFIFSSGNCSETKNDFDLEFSAYFPWLLEIFPQSLKISLNDSKMDILKLFKTGQLTFVPSSSKTNPGLLRLRIEKFQPNSVLKISIQFKKLFLRWTDFPPDYNRGFDIPAGIIKLGKIQKNDKNVKNLKNLNQKMSKMTFFEENKRFYSNQALLFMISPDMTMPFNTIIYTSIILALFITKSFNLLYGGVKYYKQRKSPLEKVIHFLIQIVYRIIKVLKFKSKF